MKHNNQVQLRKLPELRKKINDREKVIEQLRDRATNAANETICEAILQGQDLLAVKAICGHGNWGDWLRGNCPNISERRARRYMALAARAPETPELEQAESLRSALALCKMEGEENRTPTRQWPAWQEGILRASKLRGFVAKNAIATWPDEARDKLREEVKPLAVLLWPTVTF